MWKRLLCTAILAHAGFGVWAAGGNADSYPSKPARLIIGNPPGGSDDYLARVIGPRLTERFGQTVIVDNRPGVSSNLAAGIVARANPDGYTLLLGAMTPLSSSRSLYPKLGFDLLKDFSFVTMVATGAQVLLAHPSVPVKSVSELVALARSKPNGIRYATPGVANPGHLAMELLQRRAGMELLHVPYKGGAPSIIALAGGEVEIAFGAPAAALPMIKSKRLNALAVSSPKRLAALPEVPTVAESGIPGFNVTSTFGIIAPAGTPAAVVTLLNVEIRKILQVAEVKANFATQALEATGSTPDEFRALTEAETAQWARVIKDAGIRIE